MPLICPKIEVQKNSAPNGLCLLSSIKRCAPTRFFAQTRTGYQHSLTFSDGRSEHIVNREFDVGTVITIIDEWKPVRRFNTEYNSTRSVIGFARNKPGFNAFVLQKLEQELPNRVLADSCQQSGLKSQPLNANADVSRTPSDESTKTFNV